jgi:uncharacterized protein YcbX
MENLKVSQINFYPVKSCAGLSPLSCKVVDTGFEHDREWMIVDEIGNFITQRQYSKLALVKTTLIENGVRLEAPDMTVIDVPIILEGVRIETEVWGNKCVGIDQGQAISNWLSKFIGKNCKLIRMAPDFKRSIKEKYKIKGDEITGFADAFSFLLISEESLNDLNSKLNEKLPMNRFRPNIVISGGIPYQEDSWKKIKIGEMIFHIVKPCARCEITTVNQSTGEKGNEPLETLGTYRTKPKGVMFGQNLVHEGTGTIKVGDIVEVLE